MVQGGGDGIDISMARERLACRCASQLALYWDREGVGNCTREALCTSTAAGGELSTKIGRSSLLDGRNKVA